MGAETSTMTVDFGEALNQEVADAEQVNRADLQPSEQPILYRLSLEQYHLIAKHAIIGEDERVELIDGLLVKKMTKLPPHTSSMLALNYRLNRIIPEGWRVAIEAPISLPSSVSEPEPDVMILRGTHVDYAERQATPADLGLLIEIAESSYRYDRHVKSRRFAADGVPVMWILALNRRVLVVLTDPTPDGYATIREFGEADEVPIVLDGVEVARLAVREVLP